MPKEVFDKNKRETRLADINVENTEDKMIIEGYAVVFNQETLIGSEEYGYIETIDRHAFDETDTKDCCLKYNHGDAKGILARVKNGSLQLSIDDYGLKIRAELIDTTDNIDVYKCIKSQLLDKMSFAFNIKEQKIDYDSKPVRRTILKVGKLWDCAVVDIPAYEGTSIYARSLELIEKEVETFTREKAEAEARKKLEETRRANLCEKDYKLEILNIMYKH